MNVNKNVTFLLVEDDAVDVIAIERAFQQLKIGNNLVVTRDGKEALEALRGTHETKNVKSPFIIILDLNLPRMSGIEFLDEIRNDPKLHSAIVFVLTTSNDERDRRAAFKHNIAGYVVKAAEASSLSDAISMVDHYWRVVEFP